jgi:hypothetical protein
VISRSEIPEAFPNPSGSKSRTRETSKVAVRKDAREQEMNERQYEAIVARRFKKNVEMKLGREMDYGGLYDSREDETGSDPNDYYGDNDEG